ncbi:MAG: PD-(D/E)XK nuclease domain-containing protein [Kiritimatiellae bacterium]|nr:PD-(D/E)XK nuclease domain-containing protein [Kiritimatiellia bacterium]
MIEKAATDIYTFESLRKEHFTYVDKTAILKEFADMSRGGEVRTAKGRIDLAIETATDAYVVEVKRDSTPMKAIARIREHGYVDKFRLSGKSVTLIGIAFSTKKRAVGATKIARNG